MFQLLTELCKLITLNIIILVLDFVFVFKMNQQPFSVNNWVDSLKVNELKDELVARGQITTGIKGVLLARLNEVKIVYYLNLKNL